MYSSPVLAKDANGSIKRERFKTIFPNFDFRFIIFKFIKSTIFDSSKLWN